MKQAYLIKQGVEELAPAREQFALIVAQLQSAAVWAWSMARWKGWSGGRVRSS